MTNTELKFQELFKGLGEYMVKLTREVEGESHIVELRFKDVNEPPTSFSELVEKAKEVKELLADRGKLEGKVYIIENIAEFLKSKMQQLDEIYGE